MSLSSGLLSAIINASAMVLDHLHLDHPVKSSLVIANALSKVDLILSKTTCNKAGLSTVTFLEPGHVQFTCKEKLLDELTQYSNNLAGENFTEQIGKPGQLHWFYHKFLLF